MKAPSDKAIIAAMKEAIKPGISHYDRNIWFETVRLMLRDRSIANISDELKKIGEK